MHFVESKRVSALAATVARFTAQGHVLKYDDERRKNYLSSATKAQSKARITIACVNAAIAHGNVA